MGKFKKFILLEMPQKFISNGDIADELDSNAQITQNYKREYNHIDTLSFNGKNIDIYFDGNKSGGDYAFINGDATLAEYSYGSNFDGFIQTDAIWQDKSERGLFRHIFATYLLPKHGAIVSDYRLSNLGLSFWVTLFKEYGGEFGFGVFDMDTGNQKPFETSSDFAEYCSEDPKMGRWRFFVSKN